MSPDPAELEPYLNHRVDGTALPWPRLEGKVRDIYDLGDRLALVATDRMSGFDRALCSIPLKGRVLNQVSRWWFERTADICPHHLLDTPDPNVAIVRKCRVFPVEFVMRGYLTGSTSTALWTHYAAGERSYCGHTLPEGLKKHQILPEPILTPTTKDAHDRPVSLREIVELGLMSETDLERAAAAAHALFRHGQETAREHGLILVDTKYEFGVDAEGVLRVVDEIHTPDSSRYWIAGSYGPRFAAGEDPEHIDKEFIRLWFRERCDPYRDETLPTPPDSLLLETSRRYLELYHRITGQPLTLPPADEDPRQRIEANLRAYAAREA